MAKTSIGATDDGRIPVGISACVTGESVRHDGGHKHSRYCTETLARHFRFAPVCPEVGAGLGVPRPAMHLVSEGDGVRLRENRSGIDHTAAMDSWIHGQMPAFSGLRGFILMQKSPSCGLERVRVYNDQGEMVHRGGRGRFAEALVRCWPLMPVEESGRLNDDGLLECFVERVFAYDDWMRVTEPGLTARGLLAFHTRHKYQLLAHCQRTYRELGPMLADLSDVDLASVAECYIHAFMAAMARPISRGAHVNAMLHMLGHFRGRLDDAGRRDIAGQVEAYGRGEVPLVVPMTLLRLAERRFPDTYLATQHYLSPYPERLGLRNRL